MRLRGIALGRQCREHGIHLLDVDTKSVELDATLLVVGVEEGVVGPVARTAPPSQVDQSAQVSDTGDPFGEDAVDLRGHGCRPPSSVLVERSIDS